MIQVTIGEQVAEQAISAPIIAACITAAAATITGIAVATIAFRQWQTAKDKLAIDLFEKRLKAWSDLAVAMRESMVRAQDKFDGSRIGGLGEDLMIKWVDTCSDIRWLFGDEVANKTDRLESIVVKFYNEIGNLKSAGQLFDKNPQYLAVVEQIAEVRKSMKPYMMLDRIAVNRPSKAKRG